MPVAPPAGLEELSLEGNALEELPPALLHATNLTALVLASNLGLGPAIAPVGGALPRLRRLDLRHCGLEELPPGDYLQGGCSKGGVWQALPGCLQPCCLPRSPSCPIG